MHCRHTLWMIAIPIAKIFNESCFRYWGCYADESSFRSLEIRKLSFRLYKKIEKFVYKYSDSVTGISPVMCHYIKSISPSSKPVYIPAVVDTNRIFFDKVRSEARNDLIYQKMMLVLFMLDQLVHGTLLIH